MRYKPKSTAALEIALGGLPNKMPVELDPGVGVTAKTVGELRKVTAWRGGQSEFALSLSRSCGVACAFGAGR